VDTSTSQARRPSTLSLARSIVAQQGIRGLFSGFWATAARDVVGFGVYFATYEAIRKSWVGDDAPLNANTMSKLCIAGALAGVAGWLPPIYQADMIKSRMQTQRLDEPNFATYRQCVRHIIDTEGPRALFRGLGSAMLRAIPVNAVTFAVYEAVMYSLRSANDFNDRVLHEVPFVLFGVVPCEFDA
jgi:solute carrier family 25 (mitochondrial carnitine/acylcarnitine transporter), member 20/29